MKIYALTDGCYSDYHIVGIFSTKEKALDYATAGNMKDARPEVYDLDPKVPQELINGLFPYSIRIDVQDGKITYLYKQGDWIYMQAPTISKERYARESSIILSAWAKDEAHATKIAGEIRAEYLAHPVQINCSKCRTITDYIECSKASNDTRCFSCIDKE